MSLAWIQYGQTDTCTFLLTLREESGTGWNRTTEDRGTSRAWASVEAARVHGCTRDSGALLALLSPSEEKLQDAVNEHPYKLEWKL